MADPVNHPPHYTSHPSGIECIQITEHMGFNLGNAMKYIWRADLKNDSVEDLKKAQWYIERELAKKAKTAPAIEDDAIIASLMNTPEPLSDAQEYQVHKGAREYHG